MLATCHDEGGLKVKRSYGITPLLAKYAVSIHAHATWVALQNCYCTVYTCVEAAGARCPGVGGRAPKPTTLGGGVAGSVGEDVGRD